MNAYNASRRRFLKNSTLATAGVMLSGIAPSFSLPHAQADTALPLKINSTGRALVCIMLDGGNDSFNMLVPTSKAAYEEYKGSRSNLALSKEQLLPLADFTDHKGRTFGVHHSMPEVQQLFNQEKLAFIANVAPMVEPVTKEAYQNNSVQLPLGLMSHADQFNHWQTARPQDRINQGWLGYLADTLQVNRATSQIPMNISLAGSNILQNGINSTHYVINEKGSVGLVINEESIAVTERSVLNQLIEENFENLLNTEYANDPFKQTYLSITREAQAQHEVFKKAVDQVTVPATFSDTPLSQQLHMVAKSIKAAEQLNLPQQTFFVRYIGWDHHDELLSNHARMLGILSKALGEFQAALESMNVADKVMTFTGSDFGRTLTSNGNGTDHGWGGNCIVMSDTLANLGGKIHGEYPQLNLGADNPLDIGDGVLIPTMPLDKLYAELAVWFGVERESLPTLFPNLANFS